MYVKNLENKEKPKILDYWLKNEVKENVNISNKQPKKTYNKIKLFEKRKISK